MDKIALYNLLSDTEKQEFKAMFVEEHLIEPANLKTDYPAMCAHCHHENIVRNGSIRGMPRFKCKACTRTFSFNTNKLRHGSHKSLAVWSQYLDLMFQGLSVRKMVRKMRSFGMALDHKTVFSWRHKILSLLRKATRTNLTGFVEADETFFPLSFKGQRSGLPRAAHKRGTPASKRGISKDQVCVSTAVARTSGSYMKPVCLGRMSIKDFQTNLAKHIDWLKTTFITDGHRSYVVPHVKQDIIHLRVHNFGRGSKHINTVNSTHSHLKEFLKPFRGVATKYLDHYLTWFQWRNQSRSTPINECRGYITGETLRTMKMDLT